MTRANGDGSVYRSRGKWIAAVSVGAGKRVTRTRRTQTEAKIALAELLDSQAQGNLDADTATVSDLLLEWMDSITDLRPLTLASYQSNVRLHIEPALGHLRLQQLTPQHVERAMIVWRDAGASPRSVAHYRANLRAAINAGMRWGVVDRNVAGLARAVKVPKRVVRPLTLADARKLLRVLDKDRLAALYTVALTIGLTRSEALGLRWSDVDIEQGTLAVQRSLHRQGGAYRFEEPKNDYRRRTVALPEPMVAALRDHRGRQLTERLQAGEFWEGTEWGELVFATVTGRPLNGTWVLKHLQKLIARARLPRMTFHELRHASVSLMAAQGVPLRTAMDIVGHSDPRTTLAVYAHVASDAQREAADRVGSALWGEG